MNTIVVPTDFSKCALQALRAAAKFARKSDAAIKLYHCYERPIYGFVDLTVDSQKNTKIIKSLQAKLRKLMNRDFMKGINVSAALLPDVSIDKLYKRDSIKNADLIVIGSHGASGWKEKIIGSNAEKMVRYAKPPVMVIKDGAKDFKMDKVVFASDFNREIDSVFARLKKLFNLYNSKIELLRVVTPKHFNNTDDCMTKMDEFARKFYLDNYSKNVYNAESIEDGILAFAKNKNVDVITLETHGRTGFSHILAGSIAEDIANHAKRPILSVRMLT